MISCWIAGNNRWKCACHNTVLEHAHLIHICLHFQVSSFLTAETVQWLTCCQEQTFRHQTTGEELCSLDTTRGPCHPSSSQACLHLWGFPAPLSLGAVLCKAQPVGTSRQHAKASHWVVEVGRGCGCCVYLRGTGVVSEKHKHVWVLLSVLGTLWVLWLCDSIMML